MSALPKLSKSAHPLLAFTAAGLLTLLTALAYRGGLLETLELKSYDLRFHLRGVKPPRKDIILVTIDPRTVKDLNLRTTAISRKMQGMVIDELCKRGVKLIVYDMDLSKPSENPEDDYFFQQTLVENPGKVVMARYIANNEWVRPNELFRQAQVAIAQWEGKAETDRKGVLRLSWNQDSAVEAEGYGVFISERPITDPYGEGVQELEPLPGDVNSIEVPGLAKNKRYYYLVVAHQTEYLLAGEGAINELEDKDDRIRRKALLVQTMPTPENPNPERVPTLALAAALNILWPWGNPAPCPAADDEFCLAGRGKKLVIPLVSGNMLINYRGPRGTFPAVSFSRLLPGFINEKELPDFKDKIVLIGNTHPAAHDEYPTPFSSSSRAGKTRFGYTPGLEIHANALQTILDQNFIRMQGKNQAFLLTITAGIIATLIFIMLRSFSLPGIAVFVATLAGIVIAAQYLFNEHGYWMIMTPALIAVGIDYLAVLVVQTVGEYREKQFIKNAWSMYLAPAVIDQIIKNPDMLNLGGEEREMTALFSDVQGFSSIAEKLSPRDLVKLLNDYLTPMCEAIFNQQGTVDKFEGDAIIAFFGAPVPQEDHAVKACLAAMEMQEKNRELNQKLTAEGKPPLITRIGINSGTMVVGNMGSAQRMDYTIMGDAVNLASRLEGANKQYGTLIMLSEETYKQAAAAIEVRELDLITVVGKEKPVRVYELLAPKGKLDPATKKAVDLFHQGLELYRSRRWDEAIKKFKQAIAERGEDSPSRVYIERCQAFKENPPPSDWDGVFRLKTK